MTEGEKRLWLKLRGFRSEYGIHVRKHVPIGPYVADFAVHSLRLVIELDGEGHENVDQKAHDLKRDAWFAEAGYRTLRLSTGTLAENLTVASRRY